MLQQNNSRNCAIKSSQKCFLSEVCHFGAATGAIEVGKRKHDTDDDDHSAYAEDEEDEDEDGGNSVSD